MNKNLIFKILGIVGGVFIIVSLFLPYVNVVGFSQSLWKTYLENKQIYLAIIIMLFGILPAFLHLINMKVEFSYMSVGALGFFLIVQIVDTISGGTFKTLNVGFYLLLLGTILISISTFVLSKNTKVKVLDEQIAPISNNISEPTQRSGLDAIINDSVNNQNNELGLNEVNNKEDVVSNDNQSIETLGEEIPEYQPENGINPVLSEFAISENNQGNNEENNVPVENSQMLNTQVSDKQKEELSVQNSIPITETATNINPVTGLSTQATPEVTLEQSNTSNDVQTTTDNISQNQTFGIQSQPDLAFDEPQKNEISEVSHEPQVDIFGQPK